MAEGRIISIRGEAIVLRTWPFHEADLLVSLLTRDQGKLTGVARHAMRSRRRFGGALEPATQVRAHYTQQPRQELARLDHFEILWSPLSAPLDYLRVAGMQLVVEVLEEAMPELAADDNIYRLALTTLKAMQPQANSAASQAVWLPVTYFCLWMNRLMGWMPELGHCAVCGLDLRGAPVWWSAAGDGVTCADDCRSQSHALSAASVGESYRMARASLADLAAEPWPASRAADLRGFAVGMLERHLERRLRSAAALLSAPVR